MACFVIVIVLFYRKESLENKKSEKSEGDQKKPKDSKVLILKLISFLTNNFTDFSREYFVLYIVQFFLWTHHPYIFFPGKGNLVLILCILTGSLKPEKSFWFQDILRGEQNY